MGDRYGPFTMGWGKRRSNGVIRGLGDNESGEKWLTARLYI